MHFQRRQLFRILPFAFGSSFLLKRDTLSIAAQVTTPPSGATETEKVTGIGGLFFRAHDPAALGLWYQEHLGVVLTPTSHNQPVWRQEAGTTAFTPFAETSGYFGDTNKDWMVNFRVRDLEKMAAQLRAAGIAIKVDPQSYPVGRFARLHDPEGNPIELWQPA